MLFEDGERCGDRLLIALKTHWEMQAILNRGDFASMSVRGETTWTARAAINRILELLSFVGRVRLISTFHDHRYWNCKSGPHVERCFEIRQDHRWLKLCNFQKRAA